jgi:hypothetical protein
MQFLLTDKMNGKEEIRQIDLPDYFQAFKTVNALFEKDNVFAMEAKDYRNGGKSLTLRDRKNKILYQLKTI